MIMEYSAGLTSKLFWVQEAKHTPYIVKVAQQGKKALKVDLLGKI